jgi:hypothetical protein
MNFKLINELIDEAGEGEGLAVSFLRCLAMCVRARVSGLASGAALREGTQFTCFTGTKVHILTPKELREAVRWALMSLRRSSGALALAALEHAQALLLLLPRCVCACLEESSGATPSQAQMSAVASAVMGQVP